MNWCHDQSLYLPAIRNIELIFFTINYEKNINSFYNDSDGIIIICTGESGMDHYFDVNAMYDVRCLMYTMYKP